MRHAPPVTVGIALCLVLVSATLAAQHEAGEVVCPRARGPIAIDGRANEPAWAKAAAVGPLLAIATRAKPDEDLTHARLLHDDTALTLAVTCRAPREAIPARQPRDHAGVWQADHVEIFLSARPDAEDYYHLVIDRGGNVFDSWRTSTDAAKAGPAWNGAWRAAVAECEGGWSVEVSLPFAAFGATPPQPGALWRLKIGRDGGRGGPTMWPPNPASSFHARIADGALHFGTQNLLVNGDFETGRITRGAPEPWAASLTSSEVDNKPQGTVQTIDGGVAPGRRALRVTKLANALWWPQVWNWAYKLQPGGVYEFSIMAKGTMPQVNLRATGRLKGRVAKMSQGRAPTRKFSRLRFRFVVPAGSESVGVGLSAPAGAAGEVVYDNAILRRVLHADDAARAMARAYAPPDWSPEPDPVHGLDALCERAGHKPWDRFWRTDHLLSYRVMFKDRRHGTDLWLIDKSPSTQFCVTASIWPGWNADGSVLMVNGARQAADGPRKRWLCNADFSRLTPMPAGSMPLWDLADPNIYYTHVPGKVAKVDLRTGQERVLATWTPRPRERSYGLTKDNRSVFVTDHDGGLWVPYTPTDTVLPMVRVLDCYGQAPNRTDILRSLLAATEIDGKPLFRILVGTRVYTDTGRAERVVVPLCGHNEYLKTFASGRVKFPADATPPATKSLDELFQLYHLYPSCSHGHLSYSPDGEYVSWDGQARSHRVRDHGDLQTVRISPNGWVYHTCWFFDPRFHVTCVRHYRRDYDRAIRGGLLCQAFADGTWQPVCNIKMRPAAFYHQGNFATLSRDATKVHYESSMTGVPKNYVAVMARPQPPRRVRAKAEANAVVLSWTPPPHHREIQGYLAYRSRRSGDGYTLLTPKPVAATTWRDEAAERGTPYYYVVSSLEHCGLESGYSAEAARAGVGLPDAVAGPLVLYAEAEDALVDLATGDKPGVSRGRDRLGASSWYFVYRTPKAERGTATLAIDTPATGDWAVWLRVRRSGDSPAQWAVGANGQAIGRAACSTSGWTWVRAATRSVVLNRGRSTLTLSTADAGAQVDLVCLATDPAFVPKGTRPEDREAPRAVRGLEVAAVRGRSVELRWQPSPEPDLSHYNVYGAPKPISRPQQERLLASPTTTEFIDWGLRAATACHYTVTAVDRRGNESPVCAGVQAATPPRPYPPQQFELRFDQAKLAGAFGRAKAKGTRGAEYVMIPAKATAAEVAGAKVTWEVELKHAGQYYLWLRYLPKGAASARGAAVDQSVKVRLDGKHVATVGGGLTDLSVAENGIRPEFWTWARPVGTDLIGAKLPAGRHTLTLEGLTKAIRYDVLFITDEPSFAPADGRLRQR